MQNQLKMVSSEVFSVPSTHVRLHPKNPFAFFFVTGFTWGQLLASNLCTAILAVVWTLLWS